MFNLIYCVIWRGTHALAWKCRLADDFEVLVLSFLPVDFRQQAQVLRFGSTTLTCRAGSLDLSRVLMHRRDIEDLTHHCSKVGRDAKARKERWKLLWGIRAEVMNVPDTPKGSLDLGTAVSVFHYSVCVSHFPCWGGSDFLPNPDSFA